MRRQYAPHMQKAKLNGCLGNVRQNLELGYVFMGYLHPENLPLESKSVSLAIIQPTL